jgi:hypothetical protein
MEEIEGRAFQSEAMGVFSHRAWSREQGVFKSVGDLLLALSSLLF